MDKVNKIKSSSTGTTYEIESYEVNNTLKIEDATTADDRAGSTVIYNNNKNINLEPKKNVQLRCGKGKVILDTNSSVKNGNANEYQIEVQDEDETAGTKNPGDIKFDAHDIKLRPSASTETDGTKNDGSIFIDTRNNSDVNSVDLKVKTGADKGNDDEYAQLKVKSRSIDLRCYRHGGVALQPAGHDSHNFENKIKFESDRTSRIADTPTYNGEGGKGLEFGTFNNLHTSLYTGDYRFKADAKVYPVYRKKPVVTDDKTDYPTNDLEDFKDFYTPADGDDETKMAKTPTSDQGATWEEIIGAAKMSPFVNVSSKGNIQVTSEGKISIEAGSYTESRASSTNSTDTKLWKDKNKTTAVDNNAVYYGIPEASNDYSNTNIESDGVIKLEALSVASAATDMQVTQPTDYVYDKDGVAQGTLTEPTVVKGTNFNGGAKSSGEIQVNATNGISLVDEVSKKGVSKGKALLSVSVSDKKNSQEFKSALDMKKLFTSLRGYFTAGDNGSMSIDESKLTSITAKDVLEIFLNSFIYQL